ncbi:MAG: hypothetical protein V3V99_01025 [candidate division Zixibacteria bacterium]
MKRLLIMTACTLVISFQVSMSQNSETIKENGDIDKSMNVQSIQTTEISKLAEKKFDLLYESLQGTYDGFIVDVMKTLAFLIIAIGWFVTSDKSREFFRNNKTARTAAIGAVAILAAIHYLDCISAFYASQQAILLLENLKYLGSEFFTDYKIAPVMLIQYLIQNTVLFAVLIIILFTLKRNGSRA